LKLSDGTNLDGTYKFMENREKGNKKLLFKNLQAQASAYFNRNKIEPAIEQLNREITEVYQEMKNWIKELHESL
ncbi:hypothetical protein, partial [Peribacillus simplex]|uniref:hypothetical protein n=1 Tax=Peribacillus simplex TaxID=1478 RepID=UPI000BDA6EA6